MEESMMRRRKEEEGKAGEARRIDGLGSAQSERASGDLVPEWPRDKALLHVAACAQKK